VVGLAYHRFEVSSILVDWAPLRKSEVLSAMSTLDSPVIKIPQPSIVEGERLVVLAEGLDVPLSLTVCFAGEYEDQWRVMSQLEPEADDSGTFVLPEVDKLPCGTYVITRGTATRDPGTPAEVTHYPLQLILKFAARMPPKKTIKLYVNIMPHYARDVRI
jgi:hypothetical protein